MGQRTTSSHRPAHPDQQEGWLRLREISDIEGRFKYQLGLLGSCCNENCTCFTNSLALGHSAIASSQLNERDFVTDKAITSLSGKDGMNSVFTKKKKEMKEKINCSFYPFSNMGAGYHRGHNLCDTGEGQYQILRVHHTNSWTFAHLFQLCILSHSVQQLPHLLPVPSLFLSFLTSAAPLKLLINAT